MTFLEAAIEVLRREGKPLHFKELTRLAIKYDLLSVVGRDPEQMMQTRLQAEVRRPTSELTRVSPGVFGLRGQPSRNVRTEGSRPARDTGGPSGTTATADTEQAAARPVERTEEPAASTPTPSAEEPPSRGRSRGRGRDQEHRRRESAAKPGTQNQQKSSPKLEKPAEPSAAADGSTAKAGEQESRRRSQRRRGERQSAAAARESAPGPLFANLTGAGASAGADANVPAALPQAPEGPQRATVSPPSPATTEQPLAPAEEKTAAPPTSAPSAASPTPAPLSRAEEPRKEPAPRPAPEPESIPMVTLPVSETRPAVVPAPAAASAPAAPPPAPPSAVSPVPAPMPSSVLEPKSPAPLGHGPPIVAPPSLLTSSPVLTPVAPGPPSSSSQPMARPLNEAAASPRQMTLADAAYDVLRGSSDGRPIHYRQIAEIAIKRRLVRGEVVDVARALRGAMVREQRQRDGEGLRQRIRSLGQGMFALGERKLEPDLYSAERDLTDRLNRTREATRVTLRRRLRNMPAGPFELLMRLLLEKMGMLGAELIKRGEGVSYYAGPFSRGSRNFKLLCAIRPGEGEISREAVGELRAGVRLRGYDEGLLLCAARLSSPALAEVNAAPGIEAYDQDALTDLLIRHQLGVRRMQIPVDYIDTELWNELLDQSS